MVAAHEGWEELRIIRLSLRSSFDSTAKINNLRFGCFH